MIHRHDFNSDWWGAPIGIAEDLKWLHHPARKALLDGYAWTELRLPLTDTLPLEEISAAGFVFADTQLTFRIALKKVVPSSSAESLEVMSAAERPFEVGTSDIASFEHERFSTLRGCTPAKLNQRYVLWANQLIATHPETCLRFRLDHATQGWFLSHAESSSVHLTLAMASRGGQVSGLQLYQRGLAEYARRGYRLGRASFSVRNTNVHNVYAALGAQFTTPIGCWLRSTTPESIPTVEPDPKK